MSTYDEVTDDIQPPEIREPMERFRSVEFYVNLGDVRPDIRIFELIHQWMQDQPPIVLHSIQFAYHRGVGSEPDHLAANLLVGQPIDIG